MAMGTRDWDWPSCVRHWKANRGNVAIKSSPGEGITFEVMFPE